METFMASQPAPQFPLLYKDLRPLSSNEHKGWKTRSLEEMPEIAKVHAVPLLVEEFISAQRYYPIVFASGDAPVPLALMGLNEGMNVFLDEKGKLYGPTYMPAYFRRYPFILARLDQSSESLSLCFDPSSNMVGEFEDGNALFDGEQPSEATQSILKFCEEFEMSAQRTSAFVEELKKLDLLMSGELTITMNDGSPPAIYRGFQMVNEEKLRELRGDELRKLNQSGALPVIMAHLFSLQLAREIYMKQIEQGKLKPTAAVPQAEPAQA
jgi:hypothetical protein